MNRTFFLVLAAILLAAAPALAGTFTDNGDSTVSDSDSGLMWQQTEGGAMNWGAALTYCESLALAAHSDWRLPNIKELESLTDDTRSYPAIDPVFTAAHASFYWSSTTYAGSTADAWSVNFYYGYVHDSLKTFNYYVRCVR